MNCPKCQSNEPLVVIERHCVELDYCAECHGVWFDRHELNLLFLQEESNASDSKPDWEMALMSGTCSLSLKEEACVCPRCLVLMEKMPVGEACLLDRCGQGHGFWFDAGELDSVRAYLSSQKASETSFEGKVLPVLHFVEEVLAGDANSLG